VGVIPLRPLTVGEVLDGAVSAIRAHPKVMLGLSAVVAAIAQLLQLALTASSLRDISTSGLLEPGATGSLEPGGQAQLRDALSGALGGLTVSGLVTGLAVLVLTGILTVVVAEAVLGRSVDAGTAWSRVRPVLGRLIGMTLLVGVGIAAPVALVALLAAVTGSPAVLVLLLPLAVLIVYVAVRVALASVAIVLEGASVTGSLARSWQLVGGAWWHTLGVLLLAAVITSVVSAIISLPFTALAGAVGDPTAPGPLLVSTLGSIAAATLTWPFSAAVTVLLYVDRRMRREGLDLELARAAGLVGGPPAPPGSAGGAPPPPPAPPTGPPAW
jgi:hypothetical protein